MSRESEWLTLREGPETGCCFRSNPMLGQACTASHSTQHQEIVAPVNLAGGVVDFLESVRTTACQEQHASTLSPYNRSITS